MSMIGRRSLLAGAALGTALVASRAEADTLFTNFSFLATGGSSTRTMPARIADIRNVKDFGAVGNNVADDTTAIQATIDAALASGLSSSGVNFGAIVFFPPGIYKTTAPLTFGSTNASIRLVGSGRHCCAIFGSFAGYIISKPDNGRQTLEGICGLYVKNTRQNADAGAILVNAFEQGIIEDCYIQGFTGIDNSLNSYNTIIRNCTITNPFTAGTSGTVGIYTAQTGIYQSSFVGFDEGLRGSNLGLIVSGCRFEVNNTGMIIGKNPAGSNSSLSGFAITGNSFERNNTGIYLQVAAGGLIAGNAVTGTVGVDGVTIPVYGIRVGNATGCAFNGLTVSAKASVAGIDISDVSGHDNSFNGCAVSNAGTGVTWNMPTAGSALSTFTFSGCNNLAYLLTFANLPATPIEGMERDITNSNTATWAATAAGGGANRVKVRYNGTNWTVMGA